MNKGIIETLLVDWKCNNNSIKSIMIVTLYRLSSLFAQNNLYIIRLAGLPIRIIYKLIIEIVMGVEIPDKVVSGPGLSVFHGVGLVVNSKVKIGSNVTLRQSTTIGSKTHDTAPPCIGNNVDIGTNVVIIGNITISNNSIIGAGSVVINDVPSNSVVAGNPARLIK